jgi:hypothetical protein
LNGDIRNSRLVESLIRISHEYPTHRKRLVGVDVNHGRELLRVLARRTGGWIGWEATTVRQIADQLAFVALSERGKRAGSDIEIGALISDALVTAVQRDAFSAQFRRLTRNAGFRTAVKDAILALRVAGVSGNDLKSHAHRGTPTASLVPVLRAYEAMLAASPLEDTAGVLRLSLECFAQEAPFVLDGLTVLVPTVATRGLSGDLVQKLLASGARIASVDTALRDASTPTVGLFADVFIDRHAEHIPRSVLGWSQAFGVPDATDLRYDASLASVDMFAAGTPDDEVRDVCRRVLGEGLRWDDVEIVTGDPNTYGVALDSLGQRLGFGVTLLKGLPLQRTRIGHAIERWFMWLDCGLDADTLRTILEAGDLRVDGDAGADVAAAHELRLHKVGWGRARFEALLARLDRDALVVVADRELDEAMADAEMRAVARRDASQSLAGVLRALLALAPVAPAPGSLVEVSTTPASLARATLGYIALISVSGAAEEQTRDRVVDHLTAISSTSESAMPFADALAELRAAISELRAWPELPTPRTPYLAAGGMLHLTDLAHAGATGRRRTFVVGLDADMMAASAQPDPLLPDSVRRACGVGRLPELSERRAERSAELGMALSGLRGRVTLSYARRVGAQTQERAPAPVLLQVARVLDGRAEMSFAELRSRHGVPVCAVPGVAASSNAALLDTRDVWLLAMRSTQTMHDATALVCEAHPALHAGLDAEAARGGGELCAHHGTVPDAAAGLDFTGISADPVSPSSLEQLSACGLRWFYARGLGLRRIDDPSEDADQWLDSLQRGELLHEVFEAFVVAHRDAQESILADAAQATMFATAQRTIHQWRTRTLPPSESVFQRESAEIQRAALAFLAMERELLQVEPGRTWRKAEHAFGSDAPIEYVLTDGSRLRLRGRVDRIDQHPDASLVVVDFKTGKAERFRPGGKKGALNGGRLLQPAVYSAAVSVDLAQQVRGFEYRFPTDRGSNAVVAYDAASGDVTRELITQMAHDVRAGHFLATTDAEDCMVCEFAAVCRVGVDRFNKVTSPRAEWAKAHAASHAEYAAMLARRGGASDVAEDSE